MTLKETKESIIKKTVTDLMGMIPYRYHDGSNRIIVTDEILTQILSLVSDQIAQSAKAEAVREIKEFLQSRDRNYEQWWVSGLIGEKMDEYASENNISLND